MSHAVIDAVEATVTAELPQQLFRLQISDGTVILAGRSEELGRLARPIRTGNRVLVRRARLDPGRGTIVALLET
jgi:translation initiation factor IF-1